MRRTALISTLAFWGLFATQAGAHLVSPAPSTLSAAKTLGLTPLAFEANQGQAAAPADFTAQGAGYTLTLTATRARMEFAGATLDMSLVGGQPGTSAQGEGRLPGATHYLKGGRAQWRQDIPSYRRVRYQGVYPGVDVVYYGRQQQLEYDFVVHPHANPRAIGLRYAGAVQLALDPGGDLLIHTAAGVVRQHRPVIYQETAQGARATVAGAYELRGDGRVGFHVAAYDPSRPLIIDPVLVYEANPSALDSGIGAPSAVQGIAVNAGGEAYVTGTTSGGDIFVMKLNPAGTAAMYKIILGGSDYDQAGGIAIDGAGNAYITGTTQSNDFAGLTRAGASRADNDAFVVKINSTGGVVYAKYLGGTGDDYGRAIAVDGSGNAYVTGSTLSADLATVNPYQGVYGGSTGRARRLGDAYAAKLDGTGATVYATYLGGIDDDEALGIAVDDANNAYVAGRTYSTGFPSGATDLRAQPVLGCAESSGTCSDVFVVKLGVTGASPVYSTLLGGSQNDYGAGIVVDAAHRAYITGYTKSNDFSIDNGSAYQKTFGGGNQDAFLATLDAAGFSLLYSTYLGGSGDEWGYAIAVDTDGSVYVGGQTGSTNFPTYIPWQAANAGALDGFVAKLQVPATGTMVLSYASYQGSILSDTIAGIAVDGSGAIYVGGRQSNVSNPDFFLPMATKIEVQPADVSIQVAPLLTQRDSNTKLVTVLGSTFSYRLTVRNDGPDVATGIVVTDTLPASLTYVDAFPDVHSFVPDGSCSYNATTRVITCALNPLAPGGQTHITLEVQGSAAGVVVNSASVTSDHDPDNTDNSADSAEVRINTPPAATSGLTLTTPEDAPNIGTLTGTDADGDTLTYALTANPAKGTVTITNASTGAYQYWPALDANGSDKFSFRVIDSGGATSAPVEVNITVTPVNDAPVALNGNLAVLAATPTTSTLNTLTSDVEGDALSYSISTPPTLGAITSINAATGSYTFTPNADALGASNYRNDSFEYKVDDGNGGSTTAAVAVIIHIPNEVPVPATTSQYTQLALAEDAVGSAFVYATDADGDTVTYVLTSSPTHGTLTFNTATGAYSYRPNGNYHGTDSFAYRVHDDRVPGMSSSATTVQLTVTAVNDAPQAVNDSATTREDEAVTINVSSNDTDVDGDALTVNSYSLPAHGTVVNNSGSLTYRPSANYNGPDSFTYTVTDGHGGTATATVNVTITAVNDAPQFLRSGFNGIVLKVGTSASVSFQAHDPDTADTLTYTLLSGTVLGNAAITGSTLTYAATSVGKGELTVRVTDNGGLSDTTALMIIVNAADVADTNGDGLSDAQAAAAGLDPALASGDTDGDGLGDRYEIGDPAQPVDTDGDGVSDALEVSDAAANPGRIRFVIPAPAATALGLPHMAGRTVTLEATAGDALTALNNGTTGLPFYSELDRRAPDADFDYPFGVYEFSVAGTGSAVRVTLTITGDTPFVDGAVARRQDANRMWAAYPVEMAALDRQGRTVVLYLTDNSAHDTNQDLGAIRQTVGVAVPFTDPGVQAGKSGGGVWSPALLALAIPRLLRRRVPVYRA